MNAIKVQYDTVVCTNTTTVDSYLETMLNDGWKLFHMAFAATGEDDVVWSITVRK